MKLYTLLLCSLLFVSTILTANDGGSDKKENTSATTITLDGNTAVPVSLPDNSPSGSQILEDVTFGVFLGAFTYPLPIESEYCKKVREGLVVTQTNVGYVYSVGAFSNYQQAEQHRQQLIKDGYESADVISFYKNVPLLSAQK